MKKKHRKILQELMGLCNEIGGTLDGTSTNEAKYRDRQRAHMNVFKILFAVLADHPENDNHEHDWVQAEKAIEEMKSLRDKAYPDRRGNY